MGPSPPRPTPDDVRGFAKIKEELYGWLGTGGRTNVEVVNTDDQAMTEIDEIEFMIESTK